MGYVPLIIFYLQAMTINGTLVAGVVEVSYGSLLITKEGLKTTIYSKLQAGLCAATE